ncbi:hypothetical protein BKA70DRAFT_828017 [Coprinopsis sp. MPI-PUGE-AT-0042]|nr:hypothetical protein BKA70DRAFT_828017 [Coprinopsis sp. MPI-PUGE-AT-0042]
MTLGSNGCMPVCSNAAWTVSGVNEACNHCFPVLLHPGKAYDIEALESVCAVGGIAQKYDVLRHCKFNEFYGVVRAVAVQQEDSCSPIGLCACLFFEDIFKPSHADIPVSPTSVRTCYSIMADQQGSYGCAICANGHHRRHVLSIRTTLLMLSFSTSCSDYPLLAWIGKRETTLVHPVDVLGVNPSINNKFLHHLEPRFDGFRVQASRPLGVERLRPMR